MESPSITYCLECHECPRCGGKTEDPGSICHGCAERDSREIVGNSPVESGDYVEYDGEIWTVTMGPWHMVHLNPVSLNRVRPKRGVDIRDVTLVDESEVGADHWVPDYSAASPVGPDIRSDA